MYKLMNNKDENFIKLEQIDHELTQACQHRENSCCQKRLDYWSIDLYIAKQDLAIWSILKSRLQSNLPIHTIITHTKSLNIDVYSTVSKDTINADVSCF